MIKNKIFKEVLLEPKAKCEYGNCEHGPEDHEAGVCWAITDKKLINVIQDGNVIRYDGNIKNHDHLRCTECHTLYDVKVLPKNLKKKVQENYNFEVQNSSLTLEGICSKHL